MYIRVNPRDNVAILVHPEGAAPGALLPDGLVARERIPQSHKVALHNLEPGEPVLRYGQTIGFANRSISAGSWVREELLDMPAAPPLEALSLATAVPPALPLLDGYTFEGYRGADGRTGTKNILGLATTVQCVAPTVEYAARRIRTEILPRFPNVDGVVAVTHSYGCGVAIDAPGAAVPIRTLQHIGLHPNLAVQPLVVSLGCEKLQPARLFGGEIPGDFPILAEANVIRLQDERGFGESVSAIMRAAEKRLAELDRRRRHTTPASQLVVGLQCGGSDAFSGVTCNPAVGYAADLLVRAGATVMFSEVTEVRDAIHLLTPRAATESVARDLIREMRWYDEYLERGAADRSANTTPGNKRGGLANIVEKALGSVAKAGSTAIPRQRFHLRHTATRVHEHARVHHGRRQSLRPRARARDQSVVVHRSRGEVGRPDRSRRRPHCDRPRHHGGSWLGAFPPHPRRRQRPPQNLGRALGPRQRALPLQSRPRDVTPKTGSFLPAFIGVHRRPYLFSYHSQTNPHRAPVDLAARVIQHFPRQHPLNLLEELVLFAPYMPREQRAKLLQQFPRWRRAQLRDQAFHRAVFRHQLRDQRHLSACRKQHLLLDLEVIRQFQLIAVRRATRQLRHVLRRRVRGQRSPRHHAQGQPVVMLVRERNQTGIAQHRTVTIPPPTAR